MYTSVGITVYPSDVYIVVDGVETLINLQ
jgi:hypothetical protein